MIKFVREIGVFPGTPVSSINKTDCHDIIEILLKVALNTITLTLYRIPFYSWFILDRFHCVFQNVLIF